MWCVESDDGGNRNSCVNGGLGVNDFAITRVYREENPNLPMADLLIVMGSPTSVANGHAGANALAEVAQVKEWLAAGRPYLGLCFGAQILATALDGRVNRMPETFRGFVPLGNARVDLQGPWLTWHQDAITAPGSAQIHGSLGHADILF